MRRRYLERDDDLLVFHSVPNWAWQAAEVYNLSFYDFLHQVLDEYFGNLPKKVTIVSVKYGDLFDIPRVAGTHYKSRHDSKVGIRGTVVQFRLDDNRKQGFDFNGESGLWVAGLRRLNK